MTESPADERQRSLPGEHPKSLHDDPQAAEALARILASDSYREAAADLGFLNEELTRGLRLQLEYLKAETLLRRHDIRNTIVVFGSARVAEPQAAQRRLDESRTAAAAKPGDADAQQRLVAATRLAEISHYYEIAREFGRVVGRSGANQGGGCTCIMTGGGPGIMEAANRGAHEAGGKTIGLNIRLPFEQGANPYITDGLHFEFHYFFMRKFWFAYLAKSLVIFPGGFGTLDEMFEILTLAQTDKLSKKIGVILYGSEYWKAVLDLKPMVEWGAIAEQDLDLLQHVDTPTEAFEHLREHLLTHHLEPQSEQEAAAPGIAKTRG
jgi:uncharacterized protein (TIGR00730 family)